MTGAASQAVLSAVSVVVPDYDAGIAFYCGVMGFRLTEDIDQGRKRWVTVEPPGGGTRLVLAGAEGTRQRAAIGDQCGGRVWLFLRTDDFGRDHARMQAAGVPFEAAPRHEPYGTVAVWRDPFGNRWDLLGPARPEAEDRTDDRAGAGGSAQGPGGATSGHAATGGLTDSGSLA